MWMDMDVFVGGCVGGGGCMCMCVCVWYMCVCMCHKCYLLFSQSQSEAEAGQGCATIHGYPEDNRSEPAVQLCQLS